MVRTLKKSFALVMSVILLLSIMLSSIQVSAESDNTVPTVSPTAVVTSTATVLPTLSVSSTSIVTSTATVLPTPSVSPTAVVTSAATVLPTPSVSPTEAVSPTAAVLPTPSVSLTSGNMDYEIKSPYESVDWNTFGHYKADFHAHSVESDGGNTPADMIEDHYTKGFDILAMTDHNFLSTTWDRTDRANTTYLSSERLEQITSGTDRGNRGMTAVPYSDEQSLSNHLNTFFAPFNNTAGASLESNIAKCEELGGISHINHPGRYTGGAGQTGEAGEAASNKPETVTKYVNLFNKYSSCVGMEIINKKDGDSASDRILWDNILSQTMPERPVWGFSNDDTHSTAATGFSYNMMLMSGNTLSNVRKSMEKGTFYAVALVSKRELGLNFAAKGPAPEITNISVDQDENSITIQGENYNSIEWIANGRTIATGNKIDLNDYEYKVSNYVRAQLKGDGGISFTQPFGITVVSAPVEKLPAQIGLTMTTDPATSVSINWTTTDIGLTDAKVMVWEKAAGENTAVTYNANIENRTVSNSTIKTGSGQTVTNKNFYSAAVTGLKPNTEYYYKCGALSIMSQVRSFTTAKISNEEYTFIYISDSQVSDNNSKGWNANMDIAKQKYPDAKFIFIAGDITNTAANEGQWESFFNQPGNAQYNDKFSGSLVSEIPVTAVMGNHDAANGGAGGMCSHFTWASQVNGVPVSYAYTYGSARYIILNIENAYSMNNEAARKAQTEFLMNETTKAKEDGLWTIVGFHKSLYSGGDHMDDSDVTFNRKYWAPILAEIGVDVVLQGHDHILSRGFVKADGTKADVTKKVSDRTYSAIQPENAPLYYVGNCGSTLKFYSMLTNNDWIKPGDPVAPNYEFLDLDSAAPAGHILNPLGPCTDDSFEGKDPEFVRVPTFTAVTVSNKSIKFETYMTGFDRETNTIIKDTFLYDSFTVNKAKESIKIDSVETAPGKKVDVKVNARNFTALAGLKVKLTYDANKLILDNVKLSPKFTTGAINTAIPGEIYFNAVSSSGVTTSSLEIATLSFKVKSDVEVPSGIPLNLKLAEACDADVQNILPEKINGVVTVTQPVLPVVSNVTFTGECVAGQVLIASYTYTDGKNRPECGTTIRWLIANSAAGEYSVIPGETNSTLTITKDMAGKSIKVEIIPANTEETGLPVRGDNGRNIVIRLGDVDKNGTTNFIDALRVLQSLTEKVVLDSQSKAAADVDGKDDINVNDVVGILNADIRLISLD